MSVVAPSLAPFTVTEAPIRGSPSEAEVTVPVTVSVCALAATLPINRQNAKSRALTELSRWHRVQCVCPIDK